MVLRRTGDVRVGTGPGVVKKLAIQVHKPKPSFAMVVSSLRGECMVSKEVKLYH